MLSAGFSVIVPATWWEIPLDDERRMRRSVETLVDRQFRGTDNQPILRRQLADEMRGVATAAQADGGLRLWLSTEVIDGVALGASLVARRLFLPVPGAGESPLAAARASLAQLGGELGVLQTRAGQALTRRRLVTRGREAFGARTASLAASRAEGVGDQTQFEAWLPTGEAGEWLVLVFSTPYQSELADALVELFAAVAGSAEWLAA
ncbi:MAG: hypothetical protein QOI42_1652 [Frankiaceae bacterium]|jgi:hypothetical protein|nr:hypothetical protein [Frankiaceae bacterium]